MIRTWAESRPPRTLQKIRQSDRKVEESRVPDGGLKHGDDLVALEVHVHNRLAHSVLEAFNVAQDEESLAQSEMGGETKMRPRGSEPPCRQPESN